MSQKDSDIICQVVIESEVMKREQEEEEEEREGKSNWLSRHKNREELN